MFLVQCINVWRENSISFSRSHPRYGLHEAGWIKSRSGANNEACFMHLQGIPLQQFGDAFA